MVRRVAAGLEPGPDAVRLGQGRRRFVVGENANAGTALGDRGDGQARLRDSADRASRSVISERRRGFVEKRGFPTTAHDQSRRGASRPLLQRCPETNPIRPVNVAARTIRGAVRLGRFTTRRTTRCWRRDSVASRPVVECSSSSEETGILPVGSASDAASVTVARVAPEKKQAAAKQRIRDIRRVARFIDPTCRRGVAKGRPAGSSRLSPLLPGSSPVGGRAETIVVPT